MRQFIPRCSLVVSVLLLGIRSLAAPAVATAQSADEAFVALVDDWWEDQLRRHPLLATHAGDHRFNDRLPEISVEAAQSEQQQLAGVQQQLAMIDAAQLSAPNRLNFRILQRVLRDDLSELGFRMYLIPITNREGFHISFPELRHRMPLRTAKDFENYLARLRTFRDYARGHIDVMRTGIEAGMTLPAVVLERYRDPIEAHIVDDPTRSLLYAPFAELPATIPPEQQATLRSAAREAITESVVPDYRDFLEFMQQDYVPAARGSIGASALPQGRDLYRHRVHRFTTLDLTPEQVHQSGLAEVERIRGEMRRIIEQVGFEGDIRAFADHLRTDSRFQASSPEALMKEVALVLKRIDGRLPELFKTLPRTPYGIKQIPDYIAPQTTSAYYQPPPGDLTRGGFYYVNTYDLKSRPLYELEALSLHEAVPGHHLQLALQMELDNLPPFRRFAGFTVFIEGWALYAERLGLEVGFYEDPYNDFGRLTYEMWRACRLVVDTGIHYFGWTRDQAIELMANNTALSLHNIRSEVDRYIAWPGQALAYKIGELKIRELRSEAEQQLQGRFDLREFHDVVLRHGSIPLDILTENVHDWIESQRHE
jgi:uncharacterized protein (DUF885 family)